MVQKIPTTLQNKFPARDHSLPSRFVPRVCYRKIRPIHFLQTVWIKDHAILQISSQITSKHQRVAHFFHETRISIRKAPCTR